MGDHVGASPVDRAKPGSKLHLVCEGRGLPLTAVVTAANVPDVVMLAAVVDDIPPVRTPSGRRRVRPGRLDADKGYDSAANRAWLRRRGVTARIARRGIESPQRLGRHRWRVERALAWLSCWRRLQVRWDRGSGRWVAFVLLACALTCFQRLWSPPERGCRQFQLPGELAARPPGGLDHRPELRLIHVDPAAPPWALVACKDRLLHGSQHDPYGGRTVNKDLPGSRPAWMRQARSRPASAMIHSSSHRHARTRPELAFTEGKPNVV